MKEYSVTMINSPFLRSFKHTFKIEESERELSGHEYIFKYILMYGCGFLQDRYLRKIGGNDTLTFEVTYLFNDKASDDTIMEELKKLAVDISS